MNGILLVDKPTDWTSQDVVAKLRGVMHEKRCGHSGTLDPMATGLLVLFFGRATRAAQYSEAEAKEYAAGIRFGVVTDTQDITGTVLEEKNPSFTADELDEVLRNFTGEIMQIPPMYSAIKVGGKRLYEIARRGGTVEREARKINIFSISRSVNVEKEMNLNVCCSRGTYIRTLCHDIGEALGCGACMSSLRRTRVGAYSIEDAHTIEEIIAAADRGEAESLLLPVDSLFADYKSMTLTANQEKRIRCGGEFSTETEGDYRLYSKNGEFLAIARAQEGKMKPTKSFYEV